MAEKTQIDNQDTIDLAQAFGLDLSRIVPGWVLHLDMFKTEERKRRPTVTEHAARVSVQAAALATQVGMDEADVERLRVATLWHDVGKLNIPDAVISKPGQFTEVEREIMKNHAADGADMMGESVPGLLRDLAANHHERYDGKGYHGLTGEEISYEARIVQIADIYDALVSKREYKDSMSPAVVLEMMSRDTPEGAFGRRGFDPFLLRQFVAMKLPDLRMAMKTQNYDGPDADLQAAAEKSRAEGVVDPSVMAALETYVASAPMTDLDYGDSTKWVHIDRDGTRHHLEYDDGITPSVTSVTGANGRRHHAQAPETPAFRP